MNFEVIEDEDNSSPEENLENVRIVPPSSGEIDEIQHDILTKDGIKKRIVEKALRQASLTNEVSKGNVFTGPNEDRTAKYTCRQCCCRRDIFLVSIYAIFVNILALALLVALLAMTLAMGSASALWVFFGVFLLFVFSIIGAIQINKALKAESKNKEEIKTFNTTESFPLNETKNSDIPTNLAEAVI